MLSALYGTCPGPVRREECHREIVENQAERQPFRSVPSWRVKLRGEVYAAVHYYSMSRSS
jgi:hypothetical protein